MKDLKRQTDEVIDTLEQNMKRLVKREEKLEGLEYISMELEEEVTVTASSVNKVERIGIFLPKYVFLNYIVIRCF